MMYSWGTRGNDSDCDWPVSAVPSAFVIKASSHPSQVYINNETITPGSPPWYLTRKIETPLSATNTLKIRPPICDHSGSSRVVRQPRYIALLGVPPDTRQAMDKLSRLNRHEGLPPTTPPGPLWSTRWPSGSKPHAFFIGAVTT